MCGSQSSYPDMREGIADCRECDMNWFHKIASAYVAGPGFTRRGCKADCVVFVCYSSARDMGGGRWVRLGGWYLHKASARPISHVTLADGEATRGGGTIVLQLAVWVLTLCYPGT